jgi:hypothetical protein
MTWEDPGGQAQAVGPKGEVWFSDQWPPYGIRWYEDGAWHEVVAGVWASPLSVAPDGTVWFRGPSGIQRIRVEQLPR